MWGQPCGGSIPLARTIEDVGLIFWLLLLLLVPARVFRMSGIDTVDLIWIQNRDLPLVGDPL